MASLYLSRSTLSITLLASSAAPLGCGDDVTSVPPEEDLSIAELFEAIRENYDLVFKELHCACLVQDDIYDSIDDCRAEVGVTFFPPEWAECATEAVADLEHARDSLECLLDRWHGYATCIQQRGCAAWSSCESTALDCPALPEEFNQSIEDAQCPG